jgi:hypothetical protein
VRLNYINEIDGQLDLASMLVDQNYDGIEREVARQMKAKHMKEFGRKPTLMQKEQIDNSTDFNDEELYYLNRIAYYLFKTHGSRLRFDVFLEHVEQLQNGAFEVRLRLWLSLVNEMEITLQSGLKEKTDDLNLKVDFVSRQKVSNVLRSSYP